MERKETGKQINYWLGYEDFLKIVQVALECGCIIIKKVSGKLIYGQDLDIVTEHEHNYWFYVPEAGTLSGKTIPFNDNDINDVQGYSPTGSTVIEAGFSFRLVRTAKKVAPLTELTDKEWKHKEYITLEYLNLKETGNYKLTG